VKIIKEVKKRDNMPWIVNPGDIRSTAHIKPIIITKLKRLKVIKRKGKEIKFSTGFTKKLRTPKNIPANKSV